MHSTPLLAELTPDAPVASGESPYVPVSYSQGQSLSQAVYLSGRFIPPALCSGLAICGKCRLRVVRAPVPLLPQLADRRYFSQEELDSGWRLGCRHAPSPGLIVELPPEAQLRESEKTRTGEALSPQKFGKLHPGQDSFLALDLGTTSLYWRIFSGQTKADAEEEDVPPASSSVAAAASEQNQATPAARHIIDQGSMINPQMGAGSDVISRLAVARTSQGADQLRRLTLAAIRDIIRKTEPDRPVSGICLAANPAMTAIALGLDVTGLSRAPYTLPLAGGDWTALPDLPDAWIPPQLSPFVGGDIAAGYAALATNALLWEQDADPECGFPFLLVDMGTNGEFLLARSPDKALAASVALGPALEGIGLSCGTVAGPDAVTDFRLTPQGLLAMWPADNGPAPAHPRPGEHFFSGTERSCLKPVPSDARPSGISGTGYISLIHTLRQCGALGTNGAFTTPGSPVLQRFLRPQTDAVRRQAFLPLPNSLRLYASDVEEILKVKAAFSLGLQRLLASADLETKDLAAVYIAGSLGEHVRKEALEELGFFPPGLQTRIKGVGNASLAGAGLLLDSEKLRAALTAWAARVDTLDLAGDAAFVRDYAAAMLFSWRPRQEPGL